MSARLKPGPIGPIISVYKAPDVRGLLQSGSDLYLLRCTVRLAFLVALIGFLGTLACKTTAPRSSRSEGKSLSSVDSDDIAVESQAAVAQDRPATTATLCEALKSESFPGDAVLPQTQWLCDRAGFATLRSKAYEGRGSAVITEFFTEHDKTLYYASGFSLPGQFSKISSFGQLFCDNFEGLREKVGGLGLESVKSIRVSTKDEDACEYLQEAVPEWGVRADMKALTSYGMIEGQTAMSKVDSMIAPLNYSPLKQFSSLLLVWEGSAGNVEGVYLIKSQVNVSGSLMGATRSRLKSTISSTLEGYAKLIK